MVNNMECKGRKVWKEKRGYCDDRNRRVRRCSDVTRVFSLTLVVRQRLINASIYVYIWNTIQSYILYGQHGSAL